MNTENNIVVEFDYNKSQLEELKNEVSQIDRTSKEEIEKGIKVLVKARGIIQKQGKGYRDYHTAFNKEVLKVEKDYLEIIEPLEKELKQIIIDINNKEILEARKELLPMKLKQLEILKTIEQPTEEFLLSLDAESWVEYLNTQMKLDQENIDREEKRKQEIENAKLEAEKQAQENLEREKARMEREKQNAIDKVKREAEEKEKNAKLEQLKKENEEKELAKQKELEQARLLANKKFQDFLDEINYNPETDRRVKLEDSKIGIYRLIATYDAKEN